MPSRYRLDSAKALDLSGRLPANPGRAHGLRALTQRFTDS